MSVVMAGVIALTLSSTASTPLLAAIDGKELYTEPVPDVIAPLVQRALPQPANLAAIGSIEIVDTNLVGQVEIVDNLPIPGMPLDLKHELFSIGVGPVGAYLFKQEFPSGISENVGASLAYQPAAAAVPA